MKLFILALLLLPALLLAQDTAGVGSISGTVKNADETVTAALVCVHTTARCGNTSKEGSFRITEVRAG